MAVNLTYFFITLAIAVFVKLPIDLVAIVVGAMHQDSICINDDSRTDLPKWLIVLGCWGLIITIGHVVFRGVGTFLSKGRENDSKCMLIIFKCFNVFLGFITICLLINSFSLLCDSHILMLTATCPSTIWVTTYVISIIYVNLYGVLMTILMIEQHSDD